MKKLKITFLLLLLTVLAFAQNTEIPVENETQYAFSFTPQYVIMGGMRMDFDIKMSEKGWLTVAPVFYYMDDSYMYKPESTSYTGIGAFLNYRYFPTGKGMYAGMGLNYKYLNTDYSDYNETIAKNAKFNTYGFDITFGYQFRIVEQLFMDAFLGWGFRYSVQETVEDEAYWSDGFLGLGYSGFLPVAGLRLGFEF